MGREGISALAGFGRIPSGHKRENPRSERTELAALTVQLCAIERSIYDSGLLTITRELRFREKRAQIPKGMPKTRPGEVPGIKDQIADRLRCLTLPFLRNVTSEMVWSS